jgi:hypothetical protein
MSRTMAPVTATSWHEAGHAVLAWLVDAPVSYVEIDRSATSGRLHWWTDPDTHRWFRDDIGGRKRAMVYAAGMFAEHLWLRHILGQTHIDRRHLTDRARTDMTHLRGLCRAAATPETDADTVAAQVWSDTGRLVAGNTDAVQVVAAELCKHGWVSGYHVKHVLTGTPIRSLDLAPDDLEFWPAQYELQLEAA